MAVGVHGDDRLRLRRLDQINANDIVLVDECRQFRKVAAVIKVRRGNCAMFRIPGGGTATRGHPVRTSFECPWQRIEEYPYAETDTDDVDTYMYNLWIPHAMSVMVGGVMLATLGNCLQSNDMLGDFEYIREELQTKLQRKTVIEAVVEHDTHTVSRVHFL